MSSVVFEDQGILNQIIPTLLFISYFKKEKKLKKKPDPLFPHFRVGRWG